MFRNLGAVAAAAAIFISLMPIDAATSAPRQRGPDDAVVVAVVDFNFSPYHWDFLASKMPQQLDRSPANDLPLDRAPDNWLPGFPGPTKAFKSYNRFDLTLEEKDPNAPIQVLDAQDSDKWAKVKPSTTDEINYYWFPGTKVIGAIEFGTEQLHGETNDHGVGVTSVSVGNLHGTCPECLLVFLNIDRGQEAMALRWAMDQPWIDVITNSYGRGGLAPKIYNGPEEEPGRKASHRGQTIFFSAGNGFENAYTVTNPTYMSSEKGPDWIVTVGAVSPGEDNHYEDGLRTSEHASYLGAGKPVDVAGLGLDYPSAYRASTVSATGSSGFSGTSNAAPTIAGTYARALYLARRDMYGPSRIQRNDVVSVGAFRCGGVRPNCELGDGKLTATELRTRLLQGAIHTPAGMTTYPGGQTPPIGEDEFLNEGHGTYFARESGKKKPWLKEFERILAPLEGRAKPLPRPDGERDWMIVDSWCRQHLWGSWRGGYYRDGRTELPPMDMAWPVRTMMLYSCPVTQPPP